MKSLLFFGILSILIYSCGGKTETYSNSHAIDRTEWNETNKTAFINKCAQEIDTSICNCILEKILDSEKNVIEIGEMRQNDFMMLASDCFN